MSTEIRPGKPCAGLQLRGEQLFCVGGAAVVVVVKEPIIGRQMALAVAILE